MLYVAICCLDTSCCYEGEGRTAVLVIRLYFSIYAVHVSDCISPSSGATIL